MQVKKMLEEQEGELETQKVVIAMLLKDTTKLQVISYAHKVHLKELKKKAEMEKIWVVF